MSTTHEDHSYSLASYDEVSWRTVGCYDIGKVGTEHGIVAVWRSDDCADMEFCRNGRMYTRVFRKGYSRRYLVTLAKRFAEEKSRG